MQILVAGLNHKTAPVSLLERLTVSGNDLIKALHSLQDYDHVNEGAILSTCNRIEVYAVVSRFHGGAQDLRNFLSEFFHVAPEDFSDLLYTYHDEAAAQQLFRVAAGLDSLVVGESEILGQVRRAFTVALEEGVAGAVLTAAYRHASAAGRKARAETVIGRHPASVSSAAVDLARQALHSDDLDGRSIAIVGAGKMSTLAAQALVRHGAGDLVVVNRTEERARNLAESWEARSFPLDRLVDAIAEADIVLSSTASTGVILDRSLIEKALSRREPERKLMIIDIAVPRDVDPDVSRIPGVELRNIDDLRMVVQATASARLSATEAVEAIIQDELERFDARRKAIEAAPLLAGLARKGEEIRLAEIERASSSLAGLSESQADAVERITKRIVAKLLHQPMESVRRIASSEAADLQIAALRDLFDLDG